MERVSQLVDGNISKNWLQSNGTPGSINNVDGLYTFLTGSISGILKAEQSPYLVSDYNGINGGIGISQGESLIIEPGVVLRFGSGAGLNAEGELIAQGSPEKPIVFTSEKDSEKYFEKDFIGGGVDESYIWHYWQGIYFRNSNADSILENVKVKYTADVFSNNGNGSYAVKVAESSITLKDSTIEKGFGPGLWLVNSNSVVKNVKFIDLNKSQSSQEMGHGGVFVCGGSPEIKNSYFENNNIGIETSFRNIQCQVPETFKIIEGNPVIDNNEFVRNKIAILITGSSIPHISGNYGTENGYNGIKIPRGISQDSTLYSNPNFPYISHGSFGASGENVTLTIRAGVVIGFLGDESDFSANKIILEILGTEDKPVLFIPWGYSLWRGVKLEELNQNSKLRNLKIKYAGKEKGIPIADVAIPALKIKNCKALELKALYVENYIPREPVFIDESSTFKEGSYYFLSKDGENPIRYDL